MRPLTPLAAVLLALPAFADQSIRKELAAAADRLEEALQKNQRSTVNCRNGIEGGLLTIIDQIDALRPSDDPSKYDQVAQQLAGNLNMAKLTGCPDDVIREMTRGAGELADAQSDARRRRPSAPPPPPMPAGPGIAFSNAEITEPGPPGPVVAIPTVTLNGYQGQNVYLAWHWRPENGAWAQWETQPAIGVNSPSYRWDNPWRAVLDYGVLKQADTANTGRFQVHAGIFDMNGRELQGVDLNVQAHYPQMAPATPPGAVPADADAAAGRAAASAPAASSSRWAEPAAAAALGQPQGRDCGSGLDDPGCAMTKNGQQAMDKMTYDGFYATLRANLSESTRVTMVRDTLRTKYITARQLSAIMDLFLGENNRLDAVRHAAPHVIDPNNALGLATKFLSSTRAREYNQIMSSQH